MNFCLLKLFSLSNGFLFFCMQVGYEESSSALDESSRFWPLELMFILKQRRS